MGEWLDGDVDWWDAHTDADGVERPAGWQTTIFARVQVPGVVASEGVADLRRAVEADFDSVVDWMREKREAFVTEFVESVTRQGGVHG